MPRKTNAQLEEELAAAVAERDALAATQKTFIQKVMDYDGCHSGKVDFLTECGIDLAAMRHLKDTVLVTVAFKRHPELDTPAKIESAVVDCLDSDREIVENASTYIVNINHSDEASSEFVNGLSDDQLWEALEEV